MTYYFGIPDDYMGWSSMGKAETKQTALKKLRKMVKDNWGIPGVLFDGKPPEYMTQRTPKNAIGIAEAGPKDTIIYTERNGRQLVGSRNRHILMADGTLRPYR